MIFNGDRKTNSVPKNIRLLSPLQGFIVSPLYIGRYPMFIL